MALPNLLFRRCLLRNHVRVRRIAGRIDRPHTISIPGVLGQARVLEGRDVRSDLRDLRKVSAAISHTTLDLEASLVVRIVRPRQIDLCR